MLFGFYNPYTNTIENESQRRNMFLW